MNKQLLLIEDNATMATYIAGGLRAEGYRVDHAATASDGFRYSDAFSYALIVCDVGLPDMSGFRWVEQLRERGDRTPILFLSAKNLVDDRVKGLEVGGDDYLTKPFSFAELLARCQALIRRSRSSEEQQTELTIADLRMDLTWQKVYRGEVEIMLQPLEFRLLKYMLRNRGKVLSRSVIMERIWELNFEPDTNVVAVRMHHLRSKVDKPFERPLIHTVRGRGYVLDDRTSPLKNAD